MISNESASAPADKDTDRWLETLRDRRHVIIRPITALDRQAEREFVTELRTEARQFRLLGRVKHASEVRPDYFTQVEESREAAFVAMAREDSRERIVGVCRYRTNTAESVCQCSVTIGDEWQDLGLATLLMRHLIDFARSRGMHQITSVGAAEDTKLSDVTRHLGFTRRVDPEDASQVIHELALAQS